MADAALAADYSPTPPASPSAVAVYGPRVLLGLSVAGLLLLFFLNPYHKTPENRLLGLIIMAVGLAPAFYWIRDPSRQRIPLMAILGGFYALCYGFAGLITPVRYISGITVSEGEYTSALIAALLSLVAIYGGFRLAAGARQVDRESPPVVFGDNLDHLVLLGVFPFVTILKILLSQLHVAGVSNVIEAVGIQVFAWISYATFSGRYRGAMAIVAWGAIAVQVISIGNILSGVLFGMATVALVLGLSYVAAKRRVPVVSLIVVGLVALFLQIGKADYRAQTWNRADTATVTQKLTRFYTLSSYRLSHGGVVYSLNDAYGRYNFLHLTGAVMAKTPQDQPFLKGATYVPIFTKWIPRVLWPNKPEENIGNAWAKPYGFLGANDLVTSLNLPWLPEMFMNFGWLGVLGVSLGVGLGAGFLFRKMLLDASDPERFSAGLAVAVPLAVPESNMSLAIGMLVIALVCTRLFRLALDLSGQRTVVPSP